MGKYQTYQYDDKENIIVLEEFDSIIKAYQSIDTSCECYPFRDYYANLFSSLTFINEFCSSYKDEIIKAAQFLVGFNPEEFTNIKIDDVIVLFPSISTTTETSTTSSSSSSVVNAIRVPYYFTDDESYLVDLNNILEQELESTIYIRKNPEIVIADLKQYLQNHISDFLDIVDKLIEYKMYTTYTWRKKIFISATETNIATGEEYELICSDTFNIDDEYRQINNNVVFSASEYDVLQQFMQDIDNIVDVIITNIDMVKIFLLPQDMIKILKQYFRE